MTSGLLISHYMKSVGSNKTNTTIIIENGLTSGKIGELLEANNLIKSSKFFMLYLKVNRINDIKAGTYYINDSMNLKEIINMLRNGNNVNNDEITITFREGINMREIARVIAKNTNSTYEDVMNLYSDKNYLNSLIKDYWFVNEDILNSNIYYPLEGYLYPDTYRFMNKDVTVRDIFAKLLDQMGSILSKYKNDISNSNYSIHELLTLSSIAELEVNKASDRNKVVSVFINRLNKGINLGSDITTRYSIKLDDTRALTAKEYGIVNAYNTRSVSLAGKLPAGPIGMVSEMSIKASIYPATSDYLYFISNIKTNETFFYRYSSDFEKKKNELSSVNNGY